MRSYSRAENKILKQLFHWVSSRGLLWERFSQKDVVEKKSLQAIICFFFSFNVTDVKMPALDEAVLNV